MAKLGYTWYSKDWKTNEKVFNLTLELRGLYREFIDFAYENDNHFTVEHKYWCRMLGINKRKFDKLFAQLVEQKVILFEDGFYQIPSVEPRIQLIRGGKKSRPPIKPSDEPSAEPTGEPDSEQIEIEIESKIEIETKTKRERFKPPTVFEVRDYFYEITDNFPSANYESNIFHNFYESKNWMIGKNKMKNWKSAVSGWVNRLEKNKKTESTFTSNR